MHRKEGFFVCFLAFFYTLSFVSAAPSISLSNVNSTLATVSISGASSLYAYEVNLDYTGSVSVSSSAGFLGGSTSFGSNTRNSILSVYESRLDSSQTGVSGSGDLFNVTHTGSLTRRYALFVYADGSEEYVYYNGSSGGTSGGTSGGSSGGSSGGGGAGGGVAVNNSSIVVVPQELSITAVYQVESTRRFGIFNNGNNPATLSISSEGLEGLTFDKTQVTLQPGAQEIIVITINSQKQGLETGNIILKSGTDVVKTIPTALNVKSANFLFDSTITVLDSNKIVSPGQKLKAQVDLLQVGPKEKVDVTANYIIKDLSGNELYREQETFYVLEQKSFVKEFSTAHLQPGKYVLGLEIVYPGAFATSSSFFEVRQTGFSLNYNTIAFIVLGFMILVVLIVVIWSVSRKRKIQKFSKSKKRRS